MRNKRERRDGWFRKKRYPHFDLPKSYEEAIEVAATPECVQYHSFLPFIGYTDVKRRFRNDRENSDRSIPKKHRPKIAARKERDLKYCAHMDGYIHAFYAQQLQSLYEKYIADNSLNGVILGYRSGLGTNIHMANDAFSEIRSRQECCVVGLDIKGFFDSIDHRVLKNNLCKLLDCERMPDDWFAVFKSMTKFSWVEIDDIEKLLEVKRKDFGKPICDIQFFREKLRPSKIIQTNKESFGIPQGSPISAVFSNVYMIDFDYQIDRFIGSIGGSYRRYSDDILLICRPGDQKRIVDFIKYQISLLGEAISINEEKTEISNFSMEGNTQICDQPISYLGFFYDGDRRFMRDGTIARFYRRMTYRTRKAHADSAEAGSDRIFKRKLFRDFSHLGKANLYQYARRAAEIFGDDTPKRQLRRHMQILKRKLERAGH